MKIGFIGLGKMGGGLARNLIRSGFDVTVYDINDNAVQRTVAAGAKAADSSAELAAAIDVLFTSLPLPVHLTNLLLGDSGLLALMKPGSTVIDVSTIDPLTSRAISDAAENKAIQFLACPLGKGPAQAEDGTEPIFAGGKREVFNQLESLLNKIGTPVTYVGDVEQSTAFKIISNLIGMTNLAVLSEGLHLGRVAGIDPDLLLDLLRRDTGADSYQLGLRGPWILKDDYNPRFSVNLARKDVNLGVEMANQLAQTVPFSTLALKYLNEAQALGFGEEDVAAVYKLFQSSVNKEKDRLAATKDS